MGGSVGKFLSWNGNIGKWDPMAGVMLGSARGRPGEYLPPGLDPAHHQPYIYADGTPPPGAGRLPQPGQPGSPVMGPGGMPGGAARPIGAGAPAGPPAPWTGSTPPTMQRPMPAPQAPSTNVGAPMGTRVFINGQFTPQQYASALPKVPPGG